MPFKTASRPVSELEAEAAIDGEDLAGDEAGAGGEEEDGLATSSAVPLRCMGVRAAKRRASPVRPWSASIGPIQSSRGQRS